MGCAGVVDGLGGGGCGRRDRFGGYLYYPRCASGDRCGRAEAGKSVYCEKPVGRNVGETAALAAAIRDGGGFGYVGFTYRWTPAVVLARSLIAGGRIGEIREIHFGYQSSPFADANRPWYWKFAEDAGGGGALADQGSHAFDMARFLVGDCVPGFGLHADSRPAAAGS